MTRGPHVMARFSSMLAIASRVFRDKHMHWTLQATCPACLCDTTVALLMGIPVLCDGCSARIEIDLQFTVSHRDGDEPTAVVKR
jgi:hypothetical protein